MRPIIVDLTHFLNHPIRSGIQRVVRGIIQNWPNDVPVRYVVHDTPLDGLFEISSRIVNYASETAATADLSIEEIRVELRQLDKANRRRRVNISIHERILIPELFFDKNRALFYKRLQEELNISLSFVVYDFLPYFEPEAIRLGVGGGAHIMWYLRLIMGNGRRCFISQAVADDFISRILRVNRQRSEDLILPLGCDGLSLGRQHFDDARRSLVCLGSLDNRKGQHIILDGFLRSQISNKCKLIFIGGVPPSPSPDMQRVLDYEDDNVEVIVHASDAQILKALETARATVFVSQYEGFGLPAVESLFNGIPVVCRSDLPSIANIADGGQIRLSEVNVETIANAMNSLFDPSTISNLWHSAANLQLITWNKYTRDLVAWIAN